MAKIQWIVFDLGGVLLEVAFDNIVRELAALTGLSATDVRARLFSKPAFWTRFAEEEFSAAALHREVQDMLEAALDVEAVVRAFNAELGAEIRTTSALVPELRKQAGVACLSNTNSVHWERLLEAYPFMQHFDRRFASQMLGCSKPCDRIYERVAGLLDAPPQSILFFDDRSENVAGAAKAGWNARLYTDHETLLRDLSLFGF
jgi:putative hydrolase of the HAD superfamily